MNTEEYFNNFYKGMKKPTLDAMKYFIKEYNNFEKNMKFIHIAGTNGKGSCTEIISNILIKEGYKVGKFLSPHLIKYNERISINGVEISDEEIINLIEELKPKMDVYSKENNIQVTLFELLTIMALLYFYRNNVDFVVLETGLGGLYDCTNVITKPLVSIITSIGYDHMHILGDTLQKIAYQKAGIIKQNSDTVIFKQTEEIDNVFIKECKIKNNKLHIINEKDILNYRYDENMQYFDLKNIKNLSINLKGKVQIKNASMCLEAINIIKENGYKISDKSIKEGLSSVVHKGRMEILNKNPLIIYDGAHNEPAINNLLQMVEMYYKKYKRVYVISILERKDYEKMIKLLAKDKESIFILTSGNDEEKYASSEKLYNIAIKYKEKDKIFMMELENAIEELFKNYENTANFIVGSFYIYGTVVNKIQKLKIKKYKR